VQELRAAGIECELYPEAKKLGAQLKYADKRGFRFAVIVGEDEFSSGKCQLKELSTGEATELSRADLIRELEQRR
jgi:histidyl-tRNA synthetase